MGMEISPLAKGLDDGHHAGDELFASSVLEARKRTDNHRCLFVSWVSVRNREKGR
jgi:hypothetical protein